MKDERNLLMSVFYYTARFMVVVVNIEYINTVIVI
jgi:hypothetical protein